MKIPFSDDWHAGRILIFIGYLCLLLFPILHLFNQDHFLNPAWDGHARFHILWKSMMLVLLTITGLYLVLKQWHSGTARSIFRWIPVFVWVSYMIGQITLSFLLQPVLYHESETQFWGISTIDMVAIGLMLLGYLGAALDRQADTGAAFHFSNFTSF